MQTETVGRYEVEYSGVQLANSEKWGAWITVYGPSCNPMHRNPVIPAHRVLPDCTFASESAAEQEALKIAHELLEARTRKA
jgi:hypothetical protein